MALDASKNTQIDDPVLVLPGVGPRRAEQLAEVGIRTIRDLLYHFPRTYADRTTLTPIEAVEAGGRATIRGEVTAARLIRLRGRLTIAEVTLQDDTGTIKATWFGQGYLARTFTKGAVAIVSGEVGNYKGLALKNPDYEILDPEGDQRIHTGRIVPIYRLPAGVTQRRMRTWLHSVVDEHADKLPETLPGGLRSKRRLGPVAADLRQVHFPDSLESAESARRRFAYEELFELQRNILRRRAHRLEQELGRQHRIDGPVLKNLQKRLPFEPTAAQRRIIADTLADMASARPMARLLQGDVGSGKTLVALHAAAAAVDSGAQSAIMAPTELLAEQHAATAADLLEPLGVRVALLTGAAAPGKKTTLEAVAAGTAQVVVGTHALFQKRIAFNDLGLVIVDEQHRFGVLQRDRLARKGRYPDLLHMTATPIPRTLALTVYGAMDLSILDEMPPGRAPVETRRVAESELEIVFEHIQAEARAGRQTFIICPLVEESDKKALKAVTSHFDEWSSGPLADLRTALVHGRMDGREKDAVMRGFVRGGFDVLFATSVIEVGIDVPNATTIVIEDAASFGLTQLHQLRGRVGRGTHPAACFLLGEAKTEDGARRLETLCRTNDGFEIAEADLRLRGPGQIHGLRQHGQSDLRVADLIRDAKLIEQARTDAQHHLK